ncbi:HAD family hydrolase [Zooshikella ganghwensis]|uniref:HAD-IB family hydrolase n=1 Tax=Zooshikella ganghwensis TaxID=202772 RepID=A0A4P9VJQ7_9GAMM|nr:HAD family hydrolase [Zooshikella ganghwensis]RDH42390.1 HAD-IB family hydrolase [Zooshikella ganghwensis]
MALALFDLDHTLINGDSDLAWGEFMVEQGIADASFLTAHEAYFDQYVQGTLNIDEFLNFALEPLGKHSRQALDHWHQLFMQQKIEPMFQAKAQELLNYHRQKGDTLVVITATNAFVTTPIAQRLSVDHLIATTPEEIDNEYTGKPFGTPCFQAGKVKRLNAWLEQTSHNLAGSFFYSDSHNDLPLLETVEHPVAVDPDPQLTQIAEQRGWPIISLRSQHED